MAAIPTSLFRIASSPARALFLLLLALICVLPSAIAEAREPSPEALKKTLRQLLKDNPDIILDVLKENSETVLEIAQQGNMLRKRKAMLGQWSEDAKHPKKIDLNGRAFRGNINAPVTIVAYSDFTCPYCRQAEFTLGQLLRKYDGKVRVAFKPLPKDDPASVSLARYSTAAFILDAEKGWKFYDFMFEHVEQFEREGESFIRESSASLGYDFRKLKAEAAGATVEQRLAADRREADSMGISGTPYFLVNDLMVRGAVSKDLFEEAIEMALRLQQGK